MHLENTEELQAPLDGRIALPCCSCLESLPSSTAFPPVVKFFCGLRRLLSPVTHPCCNYFPGRPVFQY